MRIRSHPSTLILALSGHSHPRKTRCSSIPRSSGVPSRRCCPSPHPNPSLALVPAFVSGKEACDTWLVVGLHVLDTNIVWHLPALKQGLAWDGTSLFFSGTDFVASTVKEGKAYKVPRPRPPLHSSPPSTLPDEPVSALRRGVARPASQQAPTRFRVLACPHRSHASHLWGRGSTGVVAVLVWIKGPPIPPPADCGERGPRDPPDALGPGLLARRRHHLLRQHPPPPDPG